MQTIKTIIMKSFMSLMIMVQVAFYPAVAFATENTTDNSQSTTTSESATNEQPSSTNDTSTTTDSTPAEQSPASTSESPNESVSSDETTTADNSSSTQGPQSPNGADGSTYTYNEETKQWENEYYSWDPETKQTSPKEQQEYSYNPETGRWDTTEWQYNPATGKYEANTVSSDRNPNGSSSTSTRTPVMPMNGANNKPAINGFLGPDGTVSSFNGFYDSRISNDITSLARSGNASVLQNSSAGNALTGNARAMANLINLLQSSWSPSQGNMTTFISNIDGDVVGDLYIDPGQITNRNLAVKSLPSDVDINIDNNGVIENRLNLAAVSGDATVEENLKAGYARTGSAEAMANVVNVINSSIAAGDSFFGVLNIRGNLDGDILLPEGFMANLIASNAPRATIDTSQIGNSSELTDITNNNAIRNDITVNAKSGDATIDQNTIVDGRAITGDASTNITVFNLTGQEIIGSNALLVFVNVMGEWVGVITNAPAGSTAAALGSTTQNRPLPIAQNTDVSMNNVARINNDITVTAESGDATVRRNTTAGNAQTGDAKAAVNLLNISNSQISFADWFGVLFINVIGSWQGSFGIDTAAGTKPVLPPNLNSALTSNASANTNQIQDVRVFRFIPSNDGQRAASVERVDTAAILPEDDSAQAQEAVLASASQSNPGETTFNFTDSLPAPVGARDWGFTIAGISIGFGLLLAERIIALRQRRTRQN